MPDPLSIEAQCAYCNKKFTLQLENKKGLLIDSGRGLIEAVTELVPLGNPDIHTAAEKVEKRMEPHQNITIGEDGKLYCDTCADTYGF